FSEKAMRVYASADEGATWTGAVVPPLEPEPGVGCSADPGVGIDRTGRQYFSYLRSTPCETGRPRVFVATRAGADAAWTTSTKALAPLGRARFDDKPTMTVDTWPGSPFANRLYVAWSRVDYYGVYRIVVVHRDDG